MEENKYEVANRAMSNIIFLLMYGDPEVEQHACSAVANLLEVPELHKQFLDEKGLHPLLAIYKSGDRDSRAEAARAIANLVAIPDILQTVLTEGIIHPIVELLSAGESHCERFSCILLANLSTTVESQIHIVQGGVVPPLVNVLGTAGADMEARRYAALTLANLSAALSFHAAILKAGALQALFSLSNSPDMKSQCYIASTLRNLSSNISNHSFIVQEGGLQSIILLCYNPNPSVHQDAMLAIQGLSTSDNVRMKIIQEGGLDPLCQLLTNEDVEILRGACTTLCNLSLADENKYEIANCRVLPGLILCIGNEDMQIASQATATLANLAQIPENRIMVAREGAILSAITAMRSMYLEVQRGAGRLLANLCASVELMQSIIEAGGHQLFISYLLSQDATCQRMGALGLSNLCTHSQHCTTIMTSGALEPLCSFLRSGDAQVDVQRYAIIAIANLASNFENHDGLVENGILTLLTLLSSLTEAEIRQYAAFALVKLGQNSKYRQRVTDEGGLDPVLYLARTDEPEVQRETLACICSLSFAEENKVTMAKYGGISTIVNSLGAPDRDTARMACCAAANLLEIIENTDNIVSAGAIPGLVVALGRVEPEVVREAARAIGNICANMKHVDTVLKEGGLPFLVESLRSLDTQLQCMASMALCNISSNLSTQSKLLSAGLLDPILHMMKASLDSRHKGNFEMIRYALLVISNIAAYKEHHGKLVGDVLEVLTAYTKHRDIKTRRQFATLAIGNLCANPDNLQMVAKNGLLKIVISNAFPSNTDTTVTIQMQALSAIRGLSTHPLLCLQLVRDGCLEPLILAAKSVVRDVQSEVAAAFSNLSEVEGNKVAMARNGAFPSLHHLCHCNDMDTVSYAVCTLANLAEMVEGRTQKLIIDDGFVKTILQLVSTRHVATRRECARFFALLASKRGSQDAVMQDEVIQALLLFLGPKRDPVEQRFGTLAVGNLATVTKNHSALFETGIVQCLVGVSEVQDLETRRCVAFAFNSFASHEPNHHHCELMGLLKPLVRLLGDTDCDVVLHASFTMRQLSLSARCRSQFLDFDGLQALLKLSSCKEVETLREMSATLRNISLSEQVKIELCQKGGLPILIELIHCPDIEIVHQATGAVANLAEVVENQGVMLDAGILQHLKFALRFTSTDIQREAIRGIANLSTAHTHACEISGSGVHAPLVAMLSSPDFLSQRYAAMGVGNLATYPINQEKLLSEGALQPLLSLAYQENGDLESQRYAVFAITNISAAKEAHSVLIDASIMDLIVTLLDVDDVEVRNSAYISVSNLASSPDNRVALLDGTGILSHLMAVVDDSEDECGAILYAVSALRSLAIDESICHDLVKQGALTSLLRLTQSSDIHTQSEVLGCLCNLSLSGCFGDNPTVFLQVVNTENLITFLCSADVTCQLFGAVTLGNIASEQALQEPLISGGVLNPLMTVAQSADSETQRCIAYAFCNLAVGVQYRKAIVNAGGLLSIVSLACSNDSKDQFTGISTLRAISSDPCSRRAVVEAGALKALVVAGRGLLQTTEIGEEEEKPAETNENSALTRLASREAMYSICTLSLNELNKIQIVAEALPRLVDEILEKNGQDEECRLYALGTLANLSENERLHVELLRAGVAQAVISTLPSGQTPKMGQSSTTSGINSSLSSNNSWVFHEVSRTFANLLCSSASICWLDDNGDICEIGHGIALLLAANDPTTRHFAAIAASNLRHAFVEYAPLLVELIGQSRTTSCDFKWRDSSISCSDSIGDMTVLESGRHRSNRENPAPSRNDEHNIYRYAACLALAQIAGHDEGRRHLLSDSLGLGCLENLCYCVSACDDEQITFNAAFALNRLAEDPLPESKILMGSVAIPVVAGLLKCIEDYHHDTIGQLIAVLKRLCITPENALAAISEGILEPIYTKLDCMKLYGGPDSDQDATDPRKKLEFAIAQESIGLLGVLSSH